jgi:3-(3-hydroxy-phenyl)propionate hydroxylase
VLRERSSDPDFDIVIIGYGPTGAVAAALLSQSGLRVLVCERSEEIYPKPRAIAIDHEILRVFQKLGIADAIEPFTEPFTDSCFYGVHGELLRRMTMVEPPFPQAWTPSMVFTQPPVEKALRALVQTAKNATVWLNAELASLHRSVDLVTATMSDGRTVSAKYVIGCDGARSKVRELCNIELDDLGFDEPWLVADVLVNEQGLKKLPTTSVQYCEPSRPSSFLIAPKNHRRWEISLNPTDDPLIAATPEGTWNLLKRWITPDDGELWRQASYRFHALVAKRWRDGRIFIAGDAAHQQPPFLGQGMCQGIRDAVNLAWKLDAVLSEKASEAILDTYESERSAHVRELTTKLKMIGTFIGERDVEKAIERDAKILQECAGVIVPTPRQELMPALKTGCFSTQLGLDTGRGTLFPQPWLINDGYRTRMDDVIGHGWRLMVRSDISMKSLQNAELANEQLPIAVYMSTHLETDQVLRNWFKQHNCAFALIRPDNYVFGTANTKEDLKLLMTEIPTNSPSNTHRESSPKHYP